MEEIKTNFDQLTKLSTDLQLVQNELATLNKEEILLNWEASNFNVAQVVQAKEPYDKLWNTAHSFAMNSEQWLNGRQIEMIRIILELVT